LAANFFGMQSYAILIDGGFAKRKLGTYNEAAVASDFERLIDRITDLEQLSGMRLHRIYYYDSAPLQTSRDKPLQGGMVEFGATPQVAKAKQLFSELSRMPFMALRLGELSFQGWKLQPKKLLRTTSATVEISEADLVPQITQKGVDMRIGMDIAALTLKRQVQIIVLVTGDSDFVPAMKFARREGTQLYLIPLGQNLKPTMYEHSDMVIDFDCRRPPAPPAGRVVDVAGLPDPAR